MSIYQQSNITGVVISDANSISSQQSSQSNMCSYNTVRNCLKV
jgi:hypothetical protein